LPWKSCEEAGCFVLLTNVPVEEKTGLEILTIYKEQDGIERNFGFLKDPLVANDVFLKKPHRIEAMGLVLVLSLLLWRLMERTMRRKIKKENIMLQGWNNRDTVKPTSFMMVSKFSPVFVGCKRLINPSFPPFSFELCFPAMTDLHHWEARDDQSGTTESLAYYYREPGDKRYEHCRLLSGCSDQTILFLYLAQQAQRAATLRRRLLSTDSRQAD